MASQTAKPTESPAPRWHQRPRPLGVLLAAWLLLVFGLVWNPWWMPSGDAELFVVVARNLLQGNGLTFNGLPVALVPPGWPVVLAGLLSLTDQYLWLKAAQIANMLVYLLSAYAILLRFVPAPRAAVACGLAGLLWPLYPLTMWLHSDAFFCAIAGLTGLAAVTWGDGRLGRSWLLVIVLGCAAGVVVRWAALAQAFVLAALICGSGRQSRGRSGWWPFLTARHAVGVIAVFVATFGTFVVTKQAMDHHARAATQPAQRDADPARGGAVSMLAQIGVPLAAIELPEEVVAPDLFIGREDPDLTPLQETTRRALSIPQWVSWTLFAPLRVVDGFDPWGIWVDRAIGLLAMAMLAIAAVNAMRRTDEEGRRPHYLWLGVLVYVVALGMNWPHVNNRYLVPIAPFLIAGILSGLARLAFAEVGNGAGSGFARLRTGAARALRWSFVAAVVAINGALWSVDVVLCRAGSAEDFYARWEAGIYPSLIEIGVHLDSLEGVEDDQIVASERYQNLNERWEYPLSPRALVLMTGHHVRSVPTPLTGWGIRKAQSWARETGALYYVQQNPTMPGRIWHFRVPDWLEERITGWPPARARPQFELFTMQPDPIPKNPDLESLKYQPVPVLRGEALEAATRRVPHVSDRRNSSRR